MTYDEVFTYEHLYICYKKCIKGVKWKTETQRFIGKDIQYLNKIYRSLKDRTYKSDRLKQFDIVERGKPRHIQAHTLKDRIVQKCLCDYYLTPLLSKSLIYDCGATLKGKGITFSQKRLDTHLHKFYRHYGNKGYCLSVDIHHYFDSISHKILLSKLRNEIEDDDIYNLMVHLIGLFKGDYGLGLGSQISQICSLWYVNELDHFIKEKLHIKYYGRYMDDFYLIHYSKDYLYFCLKEINRILHKYELTTNKRTRIHKLYNGFVFTKIKYILTQTGKVLHILTTKTFKAMKRKIKTGIDVANILPSWTAYLKRFNCHKRFTLFLHLFLKSFI